MSKPTLLPTMLNRCPVIILASCVIALVLNGVFLHRVALVPSVNLFEDANSLGVVVSTLDSNKRNTAGNEAGSLFSNLKKAEENTVDDGETRRKSTETATDYSQSLSSDSGERGDVADDQTLSACLLIKDDNDLLGEWIAYHYFVVNLRHLVVAVDPNSETSPAAILYRWQNLTNNAFQVTLWNDTDFMPEGFLKRGSAVDPSKISGDATRSKWHEGHEDPEQVKYDNWMISNHRFRQVTFLSQCFQYLRKKKKRLTMHIDTDEFMVVNPLLRNSTAGHVQTLVKSIPVKLDTPSSLYRVLETIKKDKNYRRQSGYPCISMPRLLFGSIEKKDTAVPASFKGPASGFNSKQFETLRWKYHTNYSDTERNAQPKVIVDLQKVPETDRMFSAKPFSIHRPSMQLCRRVDQLDFYQLQRFPMAVNHYTGSWERYHAKNDSRRSARTYNFKAHVNFGYDNWLAPWLEGFIRFVGEKKAKELLREYVFANQNVVED